MCLALVAIRAHPRYRLVIAANRDEFHARAAVPAHWWRDGILAGKDRAGGGTWFGVTRQGRWALVTNFREGVPRDPDAPSRGGLVTEALHTAEAPLVHAARIAVDGGRYHGFNLLTGACDHDPRRFPGERGTVPESLRDFQDTAAYASNRASGAIALSAGIHGLSNHLLETPWPKLLRSKARLEAALAADGDLIDAAFALLADRAPAAAPALPSTGVSQQWETLLSSAFIVNPEYGTRCSTVLTIDAMGAARFLERSFDHEGRAAGEVEHAFVVTATSESAARRQESGAKT